MLNHFEPLEMSLGNVAGGLCQLRRDAPRREPRASADGVHSAETWE